MCYFCYYNTLARANLNLIILNPHNLITAIYNISIQLYKITLPIILQSKAIIEDLTAALIYNIARKLPQVGSGEKNFKNLRAF